MNDLIKKMTAPKLTWRIRERFYRHLSNQISNDVPNSTALENFKKRLYRSKDVKVVAIIEDIGRKMRDGNTFADALKKWVPENEYGVINAGDISGELPKMLNLIVESNRRMARVFASFKSALTTPAIYVLLVFGMLWSIGKYMTPELEKTLPEAKAHGLTAVLYWTGDFVTSWGVLIPIIIVISVVGTVIYSLPRWVGKTRIKAEQYLPYSFYRDMNGYMWLMSFAQLLSAGLPNTSILSRQKTQGSPWLQERIKAISFRMDNGVSLSGALLQKGSYGAPGFGFPNPDIVDDIESLADFGDFPEKITVLAMQWAEELEIKTLSFAKQFGFYAEMMMYVVMGFLMLAINDLSAQLAVVHGS